MTRPPWSADELRQLEAEAGLADTGRAEDCDEVRARLVRHPIPDARERLELTVAADHRDRRNRAFADGRSRTDREPRSHRRALPLREHRLRGPILDCVARRRAGLLPDEDRADGRGRLQPGGGVHHIACDHRLSVARSCIQLDDRLARVDGDPQLETFFFGPVAHGERGSHGPLGIVPVCNRRAEHPHHRVADELLDDSPEALDFLADAREVPVEVRADILGVEGLGTGCRVHEVDEERGDDPPFVADASRLDERGSARAAEARSLGILLAAASADPHKGSLVRFMA